MAGFYYLFRSLYLDGVSYGSYSLNSLGAYFLVTSVADLIIPSFMVVESMADEIRTGFLSASLLKPINYKIYKLFRFLGERTIRLVAALVVVGVTTLVLGRNLSYPTTLTAWLLFALSSLLAMTLSYWIFFSFSMGVFWLTRPLGLGFSLGVITSFAGGSYLPLDLLPVWAQRLTGVLPFQYVYFFPARMFLGGLSSGQIIQGLVSQVAWIGVAILLTKPSWKLGLNRYEAVGS